MAYPKPAIFLTALMALAPWSGAFVGAAEAPGQKTSGVVKLTAPQPLFNGKNFDGWTFFSNNKAEAAKPWRVEEGIIRCSGTPAGYLRTTQRYRDYRLTLEWRWNGPAPLNKSGKPITRNSGVLLHTQDKDEIWPKCIEAQLMEWHAGDFFVLGGVETAEWRALRDQALARAGDNEDARKSALGNRRLVKKSQHSEKPLGEWNTYEITCRGGTVVLKVNGVEQNRTDGVTVSEGHICLQSEGSPIDFRNIRIEPL